MWLRTITPRQIVRSVIIVALLALVIWFFRAASRALIPFVIGAALAYVLMPLVDLLGRRIPRWFATLLVVVGTLAGLVGLVFAVIIPLIEQLRLLVTTLADTRLWSRLLTSLENLYQSLSPDMQLMVDDALMQGFNTVRTNITAYVDTLITFISNSILSVVSLISFLIGFFVLPFWLFYTMRDRDAGVQGLNKLLPDWMRADTWAVLRIFDRVFSGYVRGQLLLGVIIGITSFVGLSLLELLLGTTIQYKLLVSVIAGVLELLPYIGPTLSTVVAALAGLLTSYQAAVAIVVLFFVIQQIEGAFLAPTVAGNSVQVHPALIMPVMIGMSSFGLLYAVLAAPLVATIRDLAQYTLGRFGDPPLPAGVLPSDVAGVSGASPVPHLVSPPHDVPLEQQL